MRKLEILLVLVAILAISFVSAATFVAPGLVNGGVARGSAVYVNISGTKGAFDNVTNCTITGTSALTGDTLTTKIVYNDTTSVWYANGTLNTIGEVDAADWILTGTCYNVSYSTSTITPITVTIDNTVPECQHNQSSNHAYKPTQTWQVTARNATSAQIAFGGNSPFAMTESSDVFSYTGNIPEFTYATVVATSSDGLNTTTCTLQYVKIDVDSEVTKVAILTAGEGQKQTVAAQPGINPVIIWVGLGAVALYMYKKKK